MDVVIAGGGVAGLEALLALRALAGDRVRLTLVAPDPDFTYRPLAVAEPFALGHAHRVPLSRFAEEAGAELVIDAIDGVDDGAGRVRLRDGGARSFDALLVAPGGRPVAGVEGATTWWPGGDPEIYGGLLRDIEEGYTKRLADRRPARRGLAAAGLRARAHDRRRGARDGPGRRRDHGRDARARAAVAVRRGGRAPRSRTSCARRASSSRPASSRGSTARRSCSSRAASDSTAQRVFAVPRLLGPAIEGLAADDEGFILAGDDGRVEGCERTWAAGDGVVSPLKFGGLATHQARRAAAAIARAAGAEDVPDPGEPVLHGPPARRAPHAPAARPRRRRGRAAVVATGQDRGRVPARAGSPSTASRRRPRRGAAEGGSRCTAPIRRLPGPRVAVPARPRAPVPQRRPGDRLARRRHARARGSADRWRSTHRPCCRAERRLDRVGLAFVESEERREGPRALDASAARAGGVLPDEWVEPRERWAREAGAAVR